MKCGTKKMKGGGKVHRTTRTPDGGQQYVRGNTTKEKLKTVQRVDNDYSASTLNTSKSRSPKAAGMLATARSYQVDPKDKRFAEDMKDISERGAKKLNAISRERGDKTRR